MMMMQQHHLNSGSTLHKPSSSSRTHQLPAMLVQPSTKQACIQPHRSKPSSRFLGFRPCTAEEGEGHSGTSTSTSSSIGGTKTSEDVKLKKTLVGLDALLGIKDEPAEHSSSASASNGTASASNSEQSNISISPEVMRKLADAEAQRLAQGDPTKAGPMRDGLETQFQKILTKARKLADEQAKEGGGSVEKEQQQLRVEFESLLQTISKNPDTLDKADIQKLKDAAFGPQTFWVTETRAIAEANRSGLLIRGNLRDERRKIFDHVKQKVAELFGGKYTVLMVEDAEANQMEGGASAAMGGAPPGGPRSSGAAAQAQLLNTPRIAFQVVPTAQATPPQSTGWTQVAAIILAILFVGSCGQLALAANITKLPKETLDWFSNPANFESDALPPGLENWDPSAYFASALPIFSSVLGTNVMHEIGHRISAATRNVRFGPTIFVPNFQIGAFGGLTPITSLLKDRMSLWDVAAAGPLAGTLMGAALLGIGLADSASAGEAGAAASTMMVAIPTQLFQGSLLLGSLARAVLGDTALSGSEVMVSPLVIAGWCALITQALQMLPVGSTDGGRMMQASYGREPLALTSFFTYLGLGLGLLGSSLALPFGLYVIICCRESEKYLEDNVTPAGSERATATTVAVLLAILILLPMAPELADGLGVGPGRDAFL